MPDKPEMALASMGIYVFARVSARSASPRCRRPDSSRDFGKDIIPYLVKHGKAVAHRFARSCIRSSARRRPIGAMSARSMPTGPPTSTSPDVIPALDLYDSEWPIWTYAKITPPAKFVHGGSEAGRRSTAPLRRLHRHRGVLRQLDLVHRSTCSLQRPPGGCGRAARR